MPDRYQRSYATAHATSRMLATERRMLAFGSRMQTLRVTKTILSCCSLGVDLRLYGGPAWNSHGAKLFLVHAPLILCYVCHRQTSHTMENSPKNILSCIYYDRLPSVKTQGALPSCHARVDLLVGRPAHESTKHEPHSLLRHALLVP